MKVEGICDMEDARDDLRRAQNLMWHTCKGENHQPMCCPCDMCAMWLCCSALINRLDLFIKDEGGRGW